MADRRLIGFLRRTALGALLAAACAAPAAAQEMKFFRIGTGSTGGTYYPIGGLIANAISNPPGARPCDRGGSCGPKGLIAVAQSTNGSIANVEAIRKGELESGLVQADIAYYAYKGELVFRGKPVTKLRAIARLYPEAVHLVARRDSGIGSVADLRGKRVSLGSKGSGTLVDARIVLRAFGLSVRRIKPQYLNAGPAADALRANKLDAFFLVAGPPASAVKILADAGGIMMVPINGKRLDPVLKRYPFLSRGAIPANVYRGIPETPTLSVGAQWLVSADVPEDLVYGITRALWHENARGLLDRGHPEGRNMQLKRALEGITIPLHPGAAKFYKEAGLLTDAPKKSEDKPAEKPVKKPAN